MFIYKDNADLRKQFEILLLETDTKKRELAARLAITPQNLNHTLTKKNISLDDLKIILNHIGGGYDIEINFKPREQ